MRGVHVYIIKFNLYIYSKPTSTLTTLVDGQCTCGLPIMSTLGLKVVNSTRKTFFLKFIPMGKVLNLGMHLDAYISMSDMHGC